MKRPSPKNPKFKTKPDGWKELEPFGNQPHPNLNPESRTAKGRGKFDQEISAVLKRNKSFARPPKQTVGRRVAGNNMPRGLEGKTPPPGPAIVPIKTFRKVDHAIRFPRWGQWRLVLRAIFGETPIRVDVGFVEAILTSKKKADEVHFPG